MNIQTTKYLNVHGKDPKGVGYWGFISDRGDMVWVPISMSLSAAKKWLRQSSQVTGMSSMVRNRVVWQVAP